MGPSVAQEAANEAPGPGDAESGVPMGLHFPLASQPLDPAWGGPQARLLTSQPLCVQVLGEREQTVQAQQHKTLPQPVQSHQKSKEAVKEAPGHPKGFRSQPRRLHWPRWADPSISNWDIIRESSCSG